MKTNNKKILTVGIPVYNMEKYLQRCLDSVVSSSKIDDMEIIIVNDGSKDNSLKIAMDYQLRFPSLIKVIDKKNGGWGTAINTAIQNASGKYFKNLDSDDWFETKELDKFIDLLKSLDSDIIYTPFTEVKDSGEFKYSLNPEITKEKPIKLELFLEKNNYHSYPIHALCYKTSLLIKHNYECLPRFYGDLDYIMTPLQWVKDVILYDCDLYRYYIGREGQSISMEGYWKNMPDLIEVGKKRIVVTQENVNPSLKKLFDSEKNGTINAIYFYNLLIPTSHQFYKRNRDLLKDFDKWLKFSYPEVYKETSKIKKKKIPFIKIWRLFKLNPFILKFNKV